MQGDVGRLLLRIAVGGLVLLHGIGKILDGIDPVRHAFAANGLPEVLAYLVYVGEVIAPIMVLLGLFARAGGVLIAIDIAIAVALVRMGEISAINPNGGYRLEVEAFFLLGAAAVALLGAGKLSVGGGRFN